MDLFSKITLSHFIWYLLPGLGSILFLLFPFLVFSPEITKTILTTAGPIGLILLAISLGFFLDGLRLYRLKWRYKKIKNDFFSNLQKIVGEEINPYLIQANLSDIARKQDVSGLSFHHAIWIMHGHFAIMSYLEGSLWLLMGLLINFFGKESYEIVGIFECNQLTTSLLCFGIMFLFVIIGSQFLHISNEDQETTNNMFIDFGNQFKRELQKSLNINETKP